MYVKLDENGRITATTDIKEYAQGMIEFEFPEDFDFLKQEKYRIENGELIEDPFPISAAEKKVNEEV